MGYVNLPGTFPKLLDGGLTVTSVSGAPRVLVLGTAASGLTETLFFVRRPNDAVTAFTRTGNLVRGMFEALSQDASNIFLMRIGGSRASLTGVGCTTGSPGGYTVTPNLKDDAAGSTYGVYFVNSTDVLRVFNFDTEEWVWSNDPADPIDLGEVSVSGGKCAGGGPNIGTVSFPIALEDVVGVPTTGTAFTAGTDGTNVSRIETYEALYNAYEALEFERFDIVTPQGVYLDELNVADMDEPEITTDRELDLVTSYSLINVGKANDVLGKLFVQNYQGTNYFWWDMDDNGEAEIFPTVGLASSTLDANGNTIALFHEVNFAHQLATFCYNATENYQASIGTVGVRPPSSLGLVDISRWVGELPEYTTDPLTGASIVDTAGDNGVGLLGNKFLSGKDDFRAGVKDGGFILTDTGFVDGTEQLDELGFVVDIGKYISTVGAWVVHTNPFDTTGRGYLGSAATAYGAMISTLPTNIAPTNKVMKRVGVPYRIKGSVLDDLAGIRLVMLTRKPKGIVITDAPSAARPQSDYNRLSTIRIVAEVVQTIRDAGDPFIGGPINTVQRVALNTAIEQALTTKRQEGKIQDFRYQVSITARQAILGNAVVDLIIVPAFELRRIFVSLALAGELT